MSMHDDTTTFEIVVRPAVVQGFRPHETLPVKSLPDPGQGVAAIMGGSGQAITLNKSEQGSWSRSKPVEVKRTVTRQRVYQKEPDGTVNKDNYVDVDHTTKMTMDEGGAQKQYIYAPPKEAPNIETLETGIVIPNENWAAGGGGAAP